MEYVYKYMIKSNTVVYVGRTHQLDLRIKQHENDEWYKKHNGSFQIQYIKCNSRAESEALEYYFIDKYKTKEWYNKAKVNCGSISMFDGIVFNWVDYTYGKRVHKTKDYHAKLTEIRVRFPSKDDSRNIPDYLPLIRERAKSLGYIQTNGKTKGEGNINAYILDMIEKDMQTINRDFSIARSLLD